MSQVKLGLIFLAAHVVAALIFLLDRTPGTAAALVGFPLDDAWIHMVYARGLAALQGFAYNPGQLETGATSPLWVILLVPASAASRVFGISVVLPVKLTGILVGAGASLTAARLARSLSLGVAVELSAGLAIAVDPALAFAQVSGMEVLLAAALALWGLAEVAADRKWLAAVIAGLLPLARPEMTLLAVGLLALLQWRMHQQRRSMRDRLLVLVPALVCVGGWGAYCLAVSGHPLPSTFYAKFNARSEYFSHNVALLFGRLLPAWPWFAYGAGFALWIVGARRLLRRGVVGWLAALFPVVYLLAVAGSQSLPQVRPFYWQRYFLPALPGILFCVATGAVRIAVWAWQRRRAPRAWVSVAVALALLVGALVDLPFALKRVAGLYAWNCQNVEELDVAMAMWVREHVPPGQVVAVVDAGAARYFGEHPIFDVMGLNNHRFLHRNGSSVALDGIDIFTAFPQMVPRIRESRDWQAVHRVSTAHLTICDCPQNEIVAYRRVPSAR
jgi:hypothetical protein